MLSIIAQADTPTLKILSLVSRDCNDEADKYLWRSSSIRVVQDESSGSIARSHLEEGVAIILSEKRAPRVRELTLVISAWFGLDSEDLSDDFGGMDAREYIANSCDRLYEGLQRTKNLSALTLKTYYLASPFDAIILSPEFFPKLRLFATDISTHHLLIPFWKAHPGITSLALLHFEGHFSIPPHCLPALHYLSIRHPRHSSTICGRPVNTLNLDLNAHYSCIEATRYNAILQDIESSSVALEHLVIISEVQTCDHLFTTFLVHLPCIRTLKLRDDVINGDNIRDAAFDVIAKMTFLENFEWSGVWGEEDAEVFLAVCSKPCQSLRRVVFEARGRRLAWWRADSDSEWNK